MMKNRFAFAGRQQHEGKEQNDRVPEVRERNNEPTSTPSLGAQQVPLLYAEVDTDVDMDTGSVGGEAHVFARVDVRAAIQGSVNIQASHDTAEADIALPSLDTRVFKPPIDLRIASPMTPSVHSHRSTSHVPSLSCDSERIQAADATHDLAACILWIPLV
ncbi:hypothetical protein HDU81_009193 [Chytriomyces hyalinus]|nr:hypothetical protein HDU81_009193 [Chytriomyces hyalinus]